MMRSAVLFLLCVVSLFAKGELQSVIDKAEPYAVINLPEGRFEGNNPR